MVVLLMGAISGTVFPANMQIRQRPGPDVQRKLTSARPASHRPRHVNWWLKWFSRLPAASAVAGAVARRHLSR